MSKVSIVLPSYNGEKYICQAIQSVIEQTYEDWELIIVDDCSTDNTLHIIKEYSERDSRIHVIRNSTNQKLPESLNIGFRRASGSYLTWTSDDNIFLPNAIEKMVSFLDKNNDYPMVCASMNIIDEDEKVLMQSVLYQNSEMWHNNCVGACFMYRSLVIQEIGEYDRKWFLVEDYEYWLRIISKYGKIGYIEETLYMYRVHKDSLTQKREKDICIQLSKLRKKYIVHIFDSLKKNLKYLCEIYYDLKKTKMLDEENKKRFLRMIPQLEMELEDDVDSGNVIVYGAGEYGNKAYKKYKRNIMFYVDKNTKKIGTELNDVPIISIGRLKETSQNYKLLIAVGTEKIYDVILELEKNGIKRYGVFLPQFD